MDETCQRHGLHWTFASLDAVNCVWVRRLCDLAIMVYLLIVYHKLSIVCFVPFPVVFVFTSFVLKNSVNKNIPFLIRHQTSIQSTHSCKSISIPSPMPQSPSIISNKNSSVSSGQSSSGTTLKCAGKKDDFRTCCCA